MRDALGSVNSVLIVGGTSDIGLATAAAFVRDGARRVVLAARDADAASKEAAALGSETEVSVLKFDVVTGDHSEFAAEAFAGGDIDVVVFAAGDLGDLERQTELDAARPVIDVNYSGTALSALALLEQLDRQGHGSLVFLSSAGAVRVRASNFLYGSAKAGIDSFAQGLADLRHGSGVDVLVVRPGFVHTSMTEGMKAPPFSTTPDVVATAIVDGVRRRSGVVFVPGAMRWVMLILSLLPRAVFRKLPV